MNTAAAVTTLAFASSRRPAVTYHTSQVQRLLASRTHEVADELSRLRWWSVG